MTLYPGTKKYSILTINSASVSETNSHFLCQINASSLMSDASFKAQIVDRSSILVWDLSGLVIRPSWILVDKTANTLYIYFDASVSSTVSKQYAICVSSSFTQTNAIATFTNCGITHYIGVNEQSGSTTSDYVTSENATVVANAALGNKCIFGYGGTYDNVTGRLLFTSDIIPSGDMTLDVLVKWNGYGENNSAPIISNSQFILAGLGDNTIFVKNNSGATLNRSSALISLGNWQHVTITRSGQNITYYSAGVTKGTVDAGTISAGTGTSIGNEHNALMRATFNGNIDDLMISNEIKTQEHIVTRYNMLFNPSTFSTLGSVKSTTIQSPLWNKAKMYFRAGFH